MGYERSTYTLNQFIALLNAENPTLATCAQIKPDSLKLRNLISLVILEDDGINRENSDAEQGIISLTSGDCIVFNPILNRWDLYPGNFVPVFS